MVPATWSTVSRCCTANAMGKTSSEARGATTTPPSTVLLPARANNLTKPEIDSIFARGFVASDILTERTEELEEGSHLADSVDSVPENRRTLAEKLLPKPRKTGVEEYVSSSLLSSV